MQVESATGLNRRLTLIWGIGLPHIMIAAALVVLLQALFLWRLLTPILAMPLSAPLLAGIAKALAAFESARPPGWAGHVLHQITRLWIDGSVMPPKLGRFYDGR